MAEDLKTIPTKGTFPCTCCEKTAKYCCLTCGDILCVECQRKHLRCNASRGHEIKLIQPSQYTFGRKIGCKTHCLPFKFWCKECVTSLCFECDGHRNHDTISIEYLYRIREENFEKASKDLLFSWQNFLDESKDMTEVLVEQRHQIVHRAEMIRGVLTQIEHKSIRKLQNVEEGITQRNKMYRKHSKRLVELKKEIEMKRYNLEIGEDLSNLTIHFSIPYPPKVTPLHISKSEPRNLDKGALLQMFGSFSPEDDQPDSGVWIEESCTSGGLKDAIMVHYSLPAFPHLSWINSRVDELIEILMGFDAHPKFQRLLMCGIKLMVVSSNLHDIKSLISDESPDDSRPLTERDMKVPLALVDMRNVSPIRDSDISPLLEKIERNGCYVSHGIVVNEGSFESKLTLGEDNVEIVPSNKKSIRRSITSYIEKSYVHCLDHIDQWCDENEERNIQVKSMYKGRCISFDDARDLSREIRNSIMQPLTTIPQPDRSKKQQIQKELIEDIKSTLRTHPKQTYLRGYGLMLNGKLRIDIACPEKRKRELQQRLETLVKRYGQCPEIRFGNFTVVTTVEPGDKIIPNPTKPDSYGTIGTIAKASENKLCALTCYHVAVWSSNKELFIQDQATISSLGKIKYSDPMQDFAAIEIDEAKDLKYSIKIRNEGGIPLNSALHTNEESLEGQQVFKKGATSGITRGVVVSDGYTWSGDDDGDENRDEELILVRGSIEDFGRGGDSGSIVYRYDPEDPNMDNIELISMFQGEYTEIRSEAVANLNEKKEIATKRLSRSVTNAGSLNLTFE